MLEDTNSLDGAHLVLSFVSNIQKLNHFVYSVCIVTRYDSGIV